MKEIKVTVTDSVAGALEHMAKKFHMSMDEFMSLTITQEVLRSVEEVGLKFPNHEKLVKDLQQTKKYFNEKVVPRIEKEVDMDEPW